MRINGAAQGFALTCVGLRASWNCIRKEKRSEKKGKGLTRKHAEEACQGHIHQGVEADVLMQAVESKQKKDKDSKSNKTKKKAKEKEKMSEEETKPRKPDKACLLLFCKLLQLGSSS